MEDDIFTYLTFNVSKEIKKLKKGEKSTNNTTKNKGRGNKVQQEFQTRLCPKSPGWISVYLNNSRQNWAPSTKIEKTYVSMSKADK